MKYVLLISLFYISLATPAQAATNLKELISVNVLASSSLTEVMTEISRNYAVKYDRIVSVSYESPAELALRITEGEPADIFIAEHPHWIEQLKRQGQIDVYTLTNLAENKLAIITRKNNRFTRAINPEMPLAEKLVRLANRTFIVVGDEEATAVGRYAREAITALGPWDYISQVRLPVFTSQQLRYVVSQGMFAGIGYATDAKQNLALTLYDTIPQEHYTPITYQGVVVAGENMNSARDFLSYLKSPEAQAIFIKHGFDV